MANGFIPGNLVTVEAYRATIEGTVTEVEGNWVHFRVESAKTQDGAGEYTPGDVKMVHYGQVQPSSRSSIRITADILVDMETWAAEYGITVTEVRDDVRNYLTTALSDLHELLALRGAVK